MDGMLDPTCELPRSPEAPATALVPLVPPATARTRRRAGLVGRVLLMAFVVSLGLGHGARTALGGGAPVRSAVLPDVAAPPAALPYLSPARESDWRRGHFYRPAGSTATRPDAELRPRVWLPKRRIEPRLARAYAPRACSSETSTRGC
ncbi:MAG: hypothetical protein ABFS41_04355 [Myxococcota bacterium]